MNSATVTRTQRIFVFIIIGTFTKRKGQENIVGLTLCPASMFKALDFLVRSNQ